MLHRYYIIHLFLFNNYNSPPHKCAVAPDLRFVQMKIVFGAELKTILICIIRDLCC